MRASTASKPCNDAASLIFGINPLTAMLFGFRAPRPAASDQPVARLPPRPRHCRATKQTNEFSSSQGNLLELGKRLARLRGQRYLASYAILVHLTSFLRPLWVDAVEKRL